MAKKAKEPREREETRREFFYPMAVTACRERLGAEPSANQIARAADMTDEAKRCSKELFMYGLELTHNLLDVVSQDNKIIQQTLKTPKPWQRR